MSKTAPAEAKVEEELYHLLRVVLDKHNHTIEGVRFGSVEPQYNVDHGRADLMLPTHPAKPLLILECKRKMDTGKGPAIFRDFDPMSNRVIAQALGYAVQCGASLFATTNGKVFALFTTPDKREPFRIDKHRLLIREIELKAEVVEGILNLVARWTAGLSVEKTPVDWTFILRLRSFVYYVADQLLPAIEKKLKTEERFREAFKDLRTRSPGATPKIYARESAYILMNKIVFYKVLERYYGTLSRLRPLKTHDGADYKKELGKHFEEAMRATKDFEPVFSTGIYDEAPLPDESVLLDEIDSFVEEMDKYKLEELGSDVVGFIHENLIPEEERHRLGQFYTPPPVAELITKWAVREPTDNVLDPACGSGTFLVKTYGVLGKLKPLSGKVLHSEILKQIYCIDINPFATHLTAVNLAMRDVGHPTSDMNIIEDDFFNLGPRTEAFAPFKVRTAKGETRRVIKIPDIDAVVANPPYTRYVEIPDDTLRAIDAQIGTTLGTYGLRGGIRGTVTEIGIYIYFVVHATRFLREGRGRLGMIVSNGWLQTDYGIAFAKFLLDNYKVKAVIDFSNRLFTIPLIATCVLLLEKCSNVEDRENNSVVFAYVNEPIQVERLLEVVEEPKAPPPKGLLVRRLGQSQLHGDRKWIQIMFDPQRVEKAIGSSPLMVPLGDIFTPVRGNTKWAVFSYEHALRPNIGPEEFFYLNEGTRNQWGLEKCSHPALTSVRYAKHFTFTKSDWNDLAARDSKAYFFMCNLPRSRLPKNVEEYVKWGETDCRTTIRASRGGGAIASRTWVCKEREKHRKEFRGWYDLGGVAPVPIFAVRHGWYKTRFIVPKFDVALYDATIALMPKRRLTADQLRAAAAYLNSTFTQLYIESNGRATSGGVIGFETNIAVKMPILDIRKLSNDQLQRLGGLFDKLESAARKAGGADTLARLSALEHVISEIDDCVADLTGIDKLDVEAARGLAQRMMERRTVRVREAKPETVIGEEAPRIRPPKKSAGREGTEFIAPLDKWT